MLLLYRAVPARQDDKGRTTGPQFMRLAGLRACELGVPSHLSPPSRAIRAQWLYGAVSRLPLRGQRRTGPKWAVTGFPFHSLAAKAAREHQMLAYLRTTRRLRQVRKRPIRYGF